MPHRRMEMLNLQCLHWLPQAYQYQTPPSRGKLKHRKTIEARITLLGERAGVDKKVSGSVFRFAAKFEPGSKFLCQRQHSHPRKELLFAF